MYNIIRPGTGGDPHSEPATPPLQAHETIQRLPLVSEEIQLLLTILGQIQSLSLDTPRACGTLQQSHDLLRCTIRPAGGAFQVSAYVSSLPRALVRG